MNRVLGSPCGTSGALGRTRCSRLAKCSRKRLRISFPVTGDERSLRGEPFDPPSAGELGPEDVAKAAVQAILAALPELDPDRGQRVAAPVLRERHLVGGSRRRLQDPLLQLLSRAHEMALPRRVRRELGTPGPAVEVLLRLGAAYLAHDSIHA